MSNDNNTHRGTCETCRCSIVSFDRIKWHHTPERPTIGYPGHHAQPLQPVFTPQDFAALVGQAFGHFGIVGVTS